MGAEIVGVALVLGSNESEGMLEGMLEGDSDGLTLVVGDIDGRLLIVGHKVGAGVAGRGVGAVVGTSGSNEPIVMIAQPGESLGVLIKFTVTTAVLFEPPKSGIE